MANPLGQDASHYYIWRASNDFAIHLSIHTVTQLSAQIARGAGHSRMGELRGILLGRSLDDAPLRATVIDDFELIAPADDAAGQGQESDDTLLEIACRKQRKDSELRVVGFFRSRRDGRLNMGSRDRETFGRLFSETGNVALLIQTSRRGNESDAAFFYWERGGAQPRDFGFGFPFDAGQLVAGHPGWRYPDPLEDTAAVASLPSPPDQIAEAESELAPPISDWTLPPPPVPRAAQTSIRWSRLAPTVLLVALASGAMQLAMSSRRVVAAPRTNENSVEEATQPPDVTDHVLGLSVTTKPGQLEIRWNPESAVLATADKALVKITENGVTEVLSFDQSQLHDGYVAYKPKTNDVSIRLEVTAKDGSTKSESIRSVAIP